MQFTAEQL